MPDITVLSGPEWNYQADVVGSKYAAIECVIQNTSGVRLLRVSVNVNINDQVLGLKCTELEDTKRQWLPGDKAKFRLPFNTNFLDSNQKISDRYVINTWSIDTVRDST